MNPTDHAADMREEARIDSTEIAVERDLLSRILETLQDDIDARGPCDHAVNICVCGLKRDADALAETMGLPPIYFPRERPSVSDLELD